MASMIYRTIDNIRIAHILLGHSVDLNIVRYLGVDFEGVLLLAKRTEIYAD